MSSERPPVPRSWLGGVARQGARCLEPGFRQETASYVLGRLSEKGAFFNRASQADLYYTFFGLECMLALDLPIPSERVSAYLDTFGEGEGLDLVHLSCLARCWLRVNPAGSGDGRTLHILERLDGFRHRGGGYRLKLGAAECSAYACFVAGLTRMEAGLPLEDPEGILGCLARLKAWDGSWADVPGLPSGTTTVTAAAAVVARQLTDQTEAPTTAWLLARQYPHGGFLAGVHTPFPDLLSTATALMALWVLGHPVVTLREAHLPFLEATMAENGGFTAHILDPLPDCEFTYYGLSSLGLLAGGLP